MRVVFLAALCAALAFGGWGARAQTAVESRSPAEPVRAIFHLDSPDPAQMKLLLANVRNFIGHYDDIDRPAFVKVVMNGGGLDMVRPDRSEVLDRLAVMEVEMPTVSFVACKRTLDGVAKREGREIELLDFVEMTDSGVAYMAELQMDGWAYLKP
jgi:intracellular sulfur oxidation DsrE/DsrF family protein